MEEKLVLQMDSIVKTFPGVKALDGVHLDVRRARYMPCAVRTARASPP